MFEAMKIASITKKEIFRFFIFAFAYNVRIQRTIKSAAFLTVRWNDLILVQAPSVDTGPSGIL